MSLFKRLPDPVVVLLSYLAFLVSVWAFMLAGSRTLLWLVYTMPGVVDGLLRKTIGPVGTVIAFAWCALITVMLITHAARRSSHMVDHELEQGQDHGGDADEDEQVVP